ncbi:VWA domain-containing protein [Kordia sp.]|uniref:VWA domain-containing protein n=1 Tax=Kordia sp. TaxID=1965332 RepID=UPI0025BFFC3E|nr:VWA domain-containing protein [Kordia sp.]MCH2193045.1 VWA domain-containing protein [Kordia sp.]
MRFLSVFALLLLLINPKFKQKSYFTEKPVLTIAVDNSSSLAELGYDEKVTNVLGELKNSKELQDKFEIDTYIFSKELQENDTVNFNGSQTNISKALKDINKLYKDAIAPTVLITDGNQTYGNDYQFLSSKIKQPIFPLIAGDTTKYVDLKIDQLNANKYAYLKNKFPVEVIATYTGNETIQTNLVLTTNGKPLASQALTFSPTDNSKVVNLNVSATNIGVQTLRATLTPLDTEKNKQNNSRYFAVEVIDQKVKIALISDIVHPDLGALKKDLESNELRGVDILKPNEANSVLNEYQLVILYQPNRKFQEVYQNIKRLEKNTLTVTGTQTDWNFLNDIQTSFRKDDLQETEEVQGQLNANYTNFLIENIDFSDYPPLENAFGEIEFNVAHEIILTQVISGVSTNSALLATYTDDNKRAAILAGENIWKWRANSFLAQENFIEFDTFLGKLAQYLASNKKRERLTVGYESFYYGNREIQLTAQYFNPSYEFDANANLTAIIKNKDTEETTTYPLLSSEGFYTVDLNNLPPASYDFTVRAEGKNISKSGSFKILEFDIEKQFLNADKQRLQSIATTTSGKAFHINDNSQNIISELVNDQRFKTIEKSNEKVVSLIDWKYLLAFIAVFLALEWFLRKYYGLI